MNENELTSSSQEIPDKPKSFRLSDTEFKLLTILIEQRKLHFKNPSEV